MNRISSLSPLGAFLLSACGQPVANSDESYPTYAAMFRDDDHDSDSSHETQRVSLAAERDVTTPGDEKESSPSSPPLSTNPDPLDQKLASLDEFVALTSATLASTNAVPGGVMDYLWGFRAFLGGPPINPPVEPALRRLLELTDNALSLRNRVPKRIYADPGTIHYNEYVFVHVAIASLKEKQLIANAVATLPKPARRISREVSTLSDQLSDTMVAWRRGELSSDATASTLYGYRRNLMARVQEYKSVSKYGQEVPITAFEEVISVLQRACMSSFAIDTRDSEEEQMNLDGHARSFNEFVATSDLLLQFKSVELEHLHQSELTRVRRLATSSLDPIADLSYFISQLRYHFNRISDVARNLQKRLDSAVSRHKYLQELLATASRTGKYEIDMTRTFQGIDGVTTTGEIRTLLITKDALERMVFYWREMTQLRGYIQARLTEYQRQALTDRLFILDANKRGICLKQCAADAGDVPSSLPPLDAGPDVLIPVADVSDAVEISNAQSGADDSEEPTMDLRPIPEEELSSTESQFYRRLNLLFKQIKRESVPEVKRPDALPRTATAAWDRMNLPGRAVTTTEMIFFFKGLKKLGKIEGFSPVNSGIQVHFNEQTSRVFHRRHYGFDHGTLSELRKSLRETGIDIEALRR